MEALSQGEYFFFVKKNQSNEKKNLSFLAYFHRVTHCPFSVSFYRSFDTKVTRFTK